MAKTATLEKTSGSHPLATEYEAYKTYLPRLMHQQGKYALVHASDLVGVFDTYKDALTAGYEKFGVDKKFLVKKITSVETPTILR